MVKQTLNDFLDAVASKEPAPGGGAVSAHLGALGAALCEMVANLTVCRPKYAEHDAHAQCVREEAYVLRAQLCAAMQRDTDAYKGVCAAYALSKETDEQKNERTGIVQHCLREATDAPLSTMRLSLRALRLTQSLLGASNANAASDLGVSALCLLAAIKGAWLNVLINLGCLDDADACEDYRVQGEELVREAEQIAGKLYASVRDGL